MNANVSSAGINLGSAGSGRSQEVRPQTLALQLFEPSPDVIYTIEAAAKITNVPRRTIMVYCKYKLVRREEGTSMSGYFFSGDAIRTLRRIEALRGVCGSDFAGIRIILELTTTIERMQSEITSLKYKSRTPNGEKQIF